MNAKTIYISDSTYHTAMELVARGDFSSFSDVIEYCLRFLDDYIEVVGLRSIPEIKRDNLRKVNVRLPQNVIDNLVDRNLCNRGKIYELSLVMYFGIKRIGVYSDSRSHGHPSHPF